MPLNSPYKTFPEEMKLIGAMLTGYGELEFWLTHCVGEALRDTNAAFQLFCHFQSEKERIDAADAILHPAMIALKMARSYGLVVGALRHCRTIRNQYAHCHWDGAGPELRLLNIEKTDFSCGGNRIIKYYGVTLSLLREQASYFEYCYDGIRYLYLEQQIHGGGEIEAQTHAKPTTRPRPKLHFPLD